MSKHIQALRRALAEYDRTNPESVGVELRLHLSEIVLRHLRRDDWSQCKLAEKTGLKESFISRVLHSNANCTFETAGRLLFALGIRARIEEVPSADLCFMAVHSTGEAISHSFIRGHTNGQEICKLTTETEEYPVLQIA